MKDFFIADAPQKENEVITSFFVVAAKQVRPKKSGEPYLQLTLSDRTGHLDAKMWDNVPDAIPCFEQGDFVKAAGLINRYNGRYQFTVQKIRRAGELEVEAVDFLPKTEKDIDQLWATLRGKVSSFTDSDLRRLVDSFLDDPEFAACFRVAPAAKAMHHAWIGGLLEHVVSLVELCDRIAPHYAEINRDLLLTGAVLHDVGKIYELTYANAFGYSLEGQLLGHITIGIRMIEQKIHGMPDFPANKRTLVEHLVLSHHGKYEFGSPKLPMTAEAFLLHALDDIDAKLQSIRSELSRHLAAGNAAGTMTEYVRSLERPLLSAAGYLREPLPQPAVSSADVLGDVASQVPSEAQEAAPDSSIESIPATVNGSRSRPDNGSENKSVEMQHDSGQDSSRESNQESSEVL